MIRACLATLAASLLTLYGDPARADDVTYAEDVAPILQSHCAECHRPGMIAPFPLLKYEDAAKRALHLKEITAERRMPPWHAGKGDIPFEGERRLTDAQIETIARWADTGAKRGDLAAAPKPVPVSDGWRGGEPDVVTQMDEPFEVPADGPDLNLAFRLKIPLDRLRYLRGIDIQPGAPAVVHHAVVLLDPSPEPELTEKVSKPTAADFFGFGSTPTLPLPGLIGSWTPGSPPAFVPDGYSQAISPGMELVLQIHYHPTGKVEVDQTRVGLYFSDEPPTGRMLDLFYQVNPLAGNTDLLDIPAGEERHEVRIQGEVPIDAEAFGVKTHAHYRMTDGKLTATLPDGKKLTLLVIDRWDFNWQERYVFADRPKLPEGTMLEFVGYFDNSADNPQNPFSPPRDVHYGLESDDEMFGFCVSLIPTDENLDTVRRKWMAYMESRRELPPEGVEIPEDKPLLRNVYDSNEDGRLTQDELERIPEANGLRKMVQNFLRTNVPEDETDSPAAGAPTEFRIPEEGIAVRPDWRLIRERVDTDEDGTLTQKEFDAVPAAIKGRLEEFLRRQLGE